MAIATPPHGGVGESIKRKEDGRFLHGKGNFLDDIVLPGMLHMAILRSPHAHARIKSVDTTAASAVPGVVAVVTGELMAQHNLAWMPSSPATRRPSSPPTRSASRARRWPPSSPAASTSRRTPSV